MVGSIAAFVLWLVIAFARMIWISDGRPTRIPMMIDLVIILPALVILLGFLAYDKCMSACKNKEV